MDIMIIILAPCLFLIPIGIGFAIYLISKSRKYSEKTQALIINLKWVGDTTIDDDMKYTTLNSYHPTYRFDYNGQTYEVTSSLCPYPDSKLKVGNYDTLYFDPKNPQNFITKAQKKQLIVKCVCFILVPIIFALIMFFSI